MNKIFRSSFVFFFAFFASLRFDASAQEWARFRGRDGAGISAAKTVPVQFGTAEYRWKVALPGEGHSSPVLWGKRLFLTSAEMSKGKRWLLCLDAATGKTLWSKEFGFKPYHVHDLNSAASATPTADANNVYVTLPAEDSFLVTALTHDGKELWRKELGAYPTQHGGAASPIVVDDVLIVTKESEGEGGALYAFDTKTGTVRWKKERTSAVAPYSTPLLYQPNGSAEEVIFTSTSHGFTSLNPKSGSLNWEVDGVFQQRCVSSPILAGGLIFATAGNGAGNRQAVAVRPGGRGTEAKTVYSLSRGTSYVPTPLAFGNRLYNFHDGGIVTCSKLDNGETVWSERVGGNFFGSPVCVDGKLYAINTKGECLVLATGDKFQLLAKNPLGEESRATPAVANGVLYLRTVSHLIAVGGKSAR
jgi:outer membrane protein assembly factor BamB